MLNALMMKLFLLLTVLTIHFSSFGQTYTDAMSDDEIHSFLRKTIKIKNTDSEILEWKRCDLFKELNNCNFGEFLQKENDNLINDSTLLDIQEKYKSIEKKQAKYFQILKEKKKKKKYSRVSIPIISNDGKIAIIKVMDWCGDECGSGGILIYYKVKGTWNKIDFRCTWMN